MFATADSCGGERAAPGVAAPSVFSGPPVLIEQTMTRCESLNLQTTGSHIGVTGAGVNVHVNVWDCPPESRPFTRARGVYGHHTNNCQHSQFYSQRRCFEALVVYSTYKLLQNRAAARHVPLTVNKLSCGYGLSY